MKRASCFCSHFVPICGKCRTSTMSRCVRLVPGLRRQISDIDHNVMTIRFIEEIEMSNYQITKKPGASGHTFEAPKGLAG
jgi:hypothetical protein